jgi:hypothetical protein
LLGGLGPRPHSTGERPTHSKAVAVDLEREDPDGVAGLWLSENYPLEVQELTPLSGLISGRILGRLRFLLPLRLVDTDARIAEELTLPATECGIA